MAQATAIVTVDDVLFGGGHGSVCIVYEWTVCWILIQWLLDLTDKTYCTVWSEKVVPSPLFVDSVALLLLRTTIEVTSHVIGAANSTTR